GVFPRRRIGCRCNSCTRTRAGARRIGGSSARHRLAVSASRPLRPIGSRTMTRLGERLSVFAVALIVIVLVVGLAFGAGYLVGKLLLSTKSEVMYPQIVASGSFVFFSS